jgi:uncharacterized protein (TIGR02301 family)
MPRSGAWRVLGLAIMLPPAFFAPKPMLRSLIVPSLVLCLGAATADAQIYLQPQPEPQAQPRPQPQVQPRPQPRALPRPPQPQSQAPAPTSPQAQSAPYDRDLQRLSEILGALHFLRGICGANEGQKWRNEAQSLIEAEAPTGDRHDQMVASFNRGYRAFQQSYRSCTAAADFAIRRYLDEGAKIAREITARYAN